MTPEKKDNEDKKNNKPTKRQTFHLHKKIIEALDLVAERSPAESIKSPIVNIALCDELLSRLDIHDDLELMGELSDIRGEYMNRLTNEEAEALKALQEQMQHQ